MVSSLSVETTVHLRPPQSFVYRFEDRLGPRENIVVPKAQHAKPVRSEKGISLRIVVRLLDMLASIQLDDDMRLDTREIADVWTDRVLSAKFEAGQLPSTEPIPEQVLGMGRVLRSQGLHGFVPAGLESR